MPGMNGVDMAMLIRAIHPHCRILLISGNATTQDLLDGARQHGERFDVLAKPVPPRQLLEKVSLLLGRNHRAIA
jgi:DNA-binding response OmpR family regulator